jgi:hypothetical protein
VVSPTIPNVSVFGQSIDQDRIDGASGAFTQKFSLDVPPGRNGLQSDVTLQYNSQNTSDGIVGYPWSRGLGKELREASRTCAPVLLTISNLTLLVLWFVFLFSSICDRSTRWRRPEGLVVP